MNIWHNIKTKNKKFCTIRTTFGEIAIPLLDKNKRKPDQIDNDKITLLGAALIESPNDTIKAISKEKRAIFVENKDKYGMGVFPPNCTLC